MYNRSSAISLLFSIVGQRTCGNSRGSPSRESLGFSNHVESVEELRPAEAAVEQAVDAWQSGWQGSELVAAESGRLAEQVAEAGRLEEQVVASEQVELQQVARRQQLQRARQLRSKSRAATISWTPAVSK